MQIDIKYFDFLEISFIRIRENYIKSLIPKAIEHNIKIFVQPKNEILIRKLRWSGIKPKFSHCISKLMSTEVKYNPKWHNNYLILLINHYLLTDLKGRVKKGKSKHRGVQRGSEKAHEIPENSTRKKVQFRPHNGKLLKI